jgi:hypothetical protein
VRREPLGVEDRRVLRQPGRLVGHRVDADDHRRGHVVGCLEEPAPPDDPPSIRGKHDRLGRIRREIHGDLPPAVIAERLGDELSLHLPSVIEPRGDRDLTLPRARSLFEETTTGGSTCRTR